MKRSMIPIASLLMLAVLLSGCGTVSSEKINTTQEITAAVPPKNSAVSDIVTPVAAATLIPTATPEPTATPRPSSTPEPTATPVPTTTPEPTATPKPTTTPVPTVTPRPSSTPEPTATPRPTATPVPTATPRPTATPVPTATPRPTATPVPTATPRPSSTPVPTATPRPSSTPEPTATPRPTATPVPTVTPRPTVTPKPTQAPTHRHNYSGDPIIITAPTCTEAGTGKQICSCGETRIVELHKVHCNYETITQKATCTEEGKSTTYCTICGTIKREQIISKQKHVESNWEVVIEATCTHEGLRHRICTVCNEETSIEVIPCWENHPFEWNTTGDTRTHICSECGFVGITEYRYGDAWGYYDDTEAGELWYWINEQRKTAIQGLVDDWGHPAGIKNVDPLIADSSLTDKARTRCVEAATNFCHGSNTHENLAWGYGSGREVYVAWCYSRSHARAMINPEYIYGGTAFFWYDGNDSGVNLTPIAVLTFSY